MAKFGLLLCSYLETYDQTIYCIRLLIIKLPPYVRAKNEKPVWLWRAQTKAACFLSMVLQLSFLFQDVRMKATLLGALFLIDFMFFEKQKNEENDGIGML